MTDRVIHAKDLDSLRGLAEDGKAYAKIDGVTIKFNTSGQMVAQVPTTTTAAADPTVPGAMDGDEWLVLTNGVITKQWVWDVETSSWYARPTGGSGGGSTEVADGVTILGTGTAADPFRVAPVAPSGVNIYFDATDPAAGTIFDTANPPATNDDALKEDSANTYYGNDGSVWVWNGTAYVTKTYTVPLHIKEERFTATAGQTTFTLSKTPTGKVWGFRNGVELALAFTNVGAVVTYTAANNGGMTIDAGDWIDFHYEAV